MAAKEKVVIFVHNENLRKGIEKCFGVRFDSESIPKGTSVVGMVTRNRDDSYNMLTEKPSLRAQQEDSWRQAICEALNIISFLTIDLVIKPSENLLL